jgi:hypothetical protein
MVCFYSHCDQKGVVAKCYLESTVEYMSLMVDSAVIKILRAPYKSFWISEKIRDRA